MGCELGVNATPRVREAVEEQPGRLVKAPALPGAAIAEQEGWLLSLAASTTKLGCTGVLMGCGLENRALGDFALV